MKSFPARLRAARVMKGLSLEELARRLEPGVSRQALNKYEQGLMKPGSDVLSELCRVLDVSVDFFARESSIKLENLRFRKKANLKVKQENRIREQSIDYLERYLELESLVGKPSELDNPLVNVKITSAGDVESAADKLREAWSLGNAPLFNALELLEDHHVKVLSLSADGEFSGLSSWIDSVPVIVLNNSPEIPMDRLRFTAFHELGHLLLNLDGFSDKEMEAFCHRFAGAMLIPKKKILDEFGLSRLSVHIQELGVVKQQYGISISSLLRRLKDLSVISAFSYRNMCADLKRRGAWKKEPFEYHGEEKTRRFRQLLFQGFANEVITTSKAASLNNQSLAEFRKELASTNV